MNIRHVQVSLDKMKKFRNEMEKTQYHCDYVIILSIFIQKKQRNLRHSLNLCENLSVQPPELVLGLPAYMPW